MKLITKVLEGIVDIQIFPIIGLIIFSTMFVILILKVARLSSEQVNEYSQLPLNEEDITQTSNVQKQNENEL